MSRPPSAPSRSDVVAGVTVALVLIPQAVAYAGLAGLPPQHGLYAAAFAPIAAAFLASSAYLQTGPGALTCLLTLGALLPLAPAGSPRFVALAALLAIVVGIVRATIGMLGAGGIAYMMSRPVLDGFTTGAAILIIDTQLPGALGVEVEHGGTVLAAWEAISQPTLWDPGAIALTAVTIGVVLGGRRIHARFPGVLVAVGIGLAAAMLWGVGGPGIGRVPDGLPTPDLDLPWTTLPRLIVPAIVIALVGFAEVTSIARTMAAADRQDWDPSREFVGQGAANLAAGVMGGLPVGGSFSRSALARMAGGRSRWAGAFAGLSVLLFLPVAGVLSPLPRAVLSGIVIAAVVGLVRFWPIVRLWHFTRYQWAIAWLTLILTLVLAPRVEFAVITGISLSLAVHYWRETMVRIHVEVRGSTLVLRPTGVLWFASAPALQEALTHAIAEHENLERVEIDLRGVGRVDYTGAEMVADLRDEVRAAGLEWELSHVPLHAQRVIKGVLRRYHRKGR